MPSLVLLTSLLLCEVALTKDPGEAPPFDQASWIWDSADPPRAGDSSFFRRKFDLTERPGEATVAITADNGYELWVNNERIAGELGYSGQAWGSVERFRIEKHLHPGANAVAIRAECLGGSAGLVAAILIRGSDGRKTTFVTDKGWLASGEEAENWTEPDHDDSRWQPAVVLRPMGGAPWGRLLIPAVLTDPATLVMDRSGAGGAAPAVDRFTEPQEDFTWPPGIVYIGGRAAVHSTSAAQTKWEIHGSRAWFEYDSPAPAVSGHRLYTLSPARPGAQPRMLVDAGRGLVASPAVSFDGREIVFAMVPAGEKFFKLYRIGADGSNLERLTEGPWQDYDPVFLPDGRIVFASSRTGSRDEYHANSARSLFSLETDRETIRPLTFHIVADSEPAVLADGRIVMVRSDNFMERAKVETRLHCIRPDGTGGQTVVGPDRGAIRYDRATGAEYGYSWLRNYGFGCPAPLPDGRIVCMTNFGPLICNSLPRGHESMQRMPSDVSLYDFAPLPDGRLVCSTRQGAVGVLDPRTGEAVRILDGKGGPYHSVKYLGVRSPPHVIPSTVESKENLSVSSSGYLLCKNIFDSQQIEGDWRRVKAVRVFRGKPFTLRAARHQYGHIGTEGIELGTVPLAPDGSFFIRVPADVALAIQAVDAEGRPVVNELSWIYVRPGEQRTCTGCHGSSRSAPRTLTGDILAARLPPLDVLGHGDPHRFRANNAANGGILNLQFDRFREAASIDLYRQAALEPGADATQLPPGRVIELEQLTAELRRGGENEKVSALERLAILRNREAVPALIEALKNTSDSVRRTAAMTLATCGTRAALPALSRTLRDPSPWVARAAHIALEHITGHSEAFDPFGSPARKSGQVRAWRQWLSADDGETIEKQLIERLDGEDPVDIQLAIEALGHVGSYPARSALRSFITSQKDENLVARLAAIRALGYLRDREAVNLLSRILMQGAEKRIVDRGHSHEFGWSAPPDHLAGAAAEALGRIGTPEAEERLIAAFEAYGDFWFYTVRIADHDWLRGCHSSIAHYRIAEALDTLGSRRAVRLTGKLLESVPIDTDRGLLYENDAYETVIARIIQRSGMGPRVVETCLAVLGQPGAQAVPELLPSIKRSPPARSVGGLSPESRAAHLLSVVCLRPESAPHVRAAFSRFRNQPPSRMRSWCCFFLARTLGKLRDVAAVPLLVETLDQDRKELSFGLPDPPNVFIHNAMTPAYRAAAADALGRIGARESLPTLLATVRDYDNAMEVRQAAAGALARLVDSDLKSELERLARDYPEIETRRTLLDACANISRNVDTFPTTTGN